MSDDLYNELLGSISSDPNTSVRLAKVFIKNKKIIPEIILQGIVSDEKMGGHLSRNVACDYLDRDMEVPKILLNKIIEEPLNAYYMGKSYHDHRLRVPDIILKALNNTKLGINLQSYITENFIFENNDLQNELLTKILSDPKYSLRYVKVLIQNEKPIPASIEDSFAEFPIGASEYAIIVVSNGGKVSQKILDIIIKDKDISFNFAKGILDAAQKVAPLEIINSLARDAFFAATYGIKFIKIHEKDKKILDILENGIVKGKITTYKSVDVERSETASKYVMAYVNSTGELPGKDVLQLTDPSSLVIVSNMLLSQNKQIPQEIINTIAKKGSASYAFTVRYKMIKGGKTLPSIYKKIQDSAIKYDKESI